MFVGHIQKTDIVAQANFSPLPTISNSGSLPYRPSRGPGNWRPQGDLKSMFRNLVPSYLPSPAGMELIPRLGYNLYPPVEDDRKVHNILKWASRGASFLRGEDTLAAQLLNHYLNGSGTPIVLPQSAVNHAAEDNKRSIVRRVTDIIKNTSKRQGTIKINSQWDNDRASDLINSINTYSSKIIGEVTFKKEGNQVQVFGQLVYLIQDLYSFKRYSKDHEVGTPIPQQIIDTLPSSYRSNLLLVEGKRIRDNLFAELQLTGLAQPFYTIGVSNVFNFKYDSRNRDQFYLRKQ